MRWLTARSWLAIVTLGIATAVSRAHGQGRARVEGIAVEPATGLAIPNVEIRLLGIDRAVRTDSLGGFRLNLDPGHYLVRATRLGFGPRSVALDVAAGDTLTMSIEMDVLPTRLSEVMVKGREERYRGKMA